MAKISKKQHVALREIDKLMEERKRNRILGIASILVMVVLIVAYNTLTYNLGIVDESNVVLRGMLYLSAMVIAGYSGIMLMKASRITRKIDGYRQSVGISKEILDAWQHGEYDE